MKDGGMTILLQEPSSYFADEKGGTGFTMSRKEIEDTFNELKKMKLDEVKMTEDLRLDFPSVTVQWGSGHLIKCESQVYRLKGSSEDNFYGCVFLIQNIARTKMNEKQQS